MREVMGGLGGFGHPYFPFTCNHPSYLSLRCPEMGV